MGSRVRLYGCYTHTFIQTIMILYGYTQTHIYTIFFPCIYINAIYFTYVNSLRYTLFWKILIFWLMLTWVSMLSEYFVKVQNILQCISSCICFKISKTNKLSIDTNSFVLFPFYGLGLIISIQYKITIDIGTCF